MHVYLRLFVCVAFACLLLPGCNKDEGYSKSYPGHYSPPPPGDPEWLSDSLLFFSFDMDGVTFSDSINGDLYKPGYGLHGSYTADTSALTWVSVFSPQVDSLPRVRLGKGVMKFVNNTITIDDMLDFYAPGSYPLDWTDDYQMYFALVYNDGTRYSSQYAPQSVEDQVEIEWVEEAPEGYNPLRVRARMTFSCVIYNENDLSDFRTIENGTMTGYFKAFD